MIPIFRKIRKKMADDNKPMQYLRYAIGEIVLVVIGILIALSLNNWNQNQRINKQLQNYRISLLSEINNDLETLKRLDSMNKSSTTQIKEYFSYFNSTSANIDTINIKRKNLYLLHNNFHSGIYSIDELIASGNISLFTQKEKLALVTLKKQIELYTFYEKQELAYANDKSYKWDDIQDLAFENSLILKENDKLKKFNTDINSEYFKLFHNALSASLRYYKYQDYIYFKRIKPQIIVLKNVLLENSK